MLIIGAVALIAFGPDQLPKVARRAGQVMRDVQNTSQTFIREMERAADEPTVEPPYEYRSYAQPSPAHDEATAAADHQPGDVAPSEPPAPVAEGERPRSAAHEDPANI